MPVPVAPHAEPLSVAAQPSLTGGHAVGVLLSHGFTGSPASVRPWGTFLGERGYAVESPRLPGHGTTWQDMNTTRWSDWYDEVSAALSRLRDSCDAVVVGGLSMGGALALALAAARPTEVAGVMVVNPAVATRRRDVKLLPVLKHLVPSFPAIGGDIKKQGLDEHAYPRTPLRAADSMFRAWPSLVTALPQVTAPLLYFRSTVDHVVDELSEPLILGAVSSVDVERVELPDSFHVATLDNDAPTIFSTSADFVARVTRVPSR